MFLNLTKLYCCILTQSKSTYVAYNINDAFVTFRCAINNVIKVKAHMLYNWKYLFSEMTINIFCNLHDIAQFIQQKDYILSVV